MKNIYMLKFVNNIIVANLLFSKFLNLQDDILSRFFIQLSEITFMKNILFSKKKSWLIISNKKMMID